MPTKPSEMLRPRPEPPYSRSVLAVAWAKGSNTLSRVSAAMPTPVSFTANCSHTVPAGSVEAGGLGTARQRSRT